MNWGKGITIVIILFMGFILSFVYKAFQHDFDLVQDDYYAAEASFESERESKYNYNQLEGTVEISQKEEGIFFQFPSEVDQSAKGTISFYKPDDKNYDRSFDLNLDINNQQRLEYKNFIEGYYEITVFWKSADKEFIFEDDIQF